MLGAQMPEAAIYKNQCFLLAEGKIWPDCQRTFRRRILDSVFSVPAPATNFICAKKPDENHFRPQVSTRTDFGHHSGTLDTGEYVGHTIDFKFMSPDQKQQILLKAKGFFSEQIISRHKTNIKKLSNPKKFDVNPFLSHYLAKMLCGDTSPDSIARVLVYPRVLSSSINTTLGNQLQYFCNEVLEGYASKVAGIDLEFVDSFDKRKKYCQLKLGPNTINSKDVTTIVDEFSAVKNLARTNRAMDLRFDDLVVGVAYGHADQLNPNYRALRDGHNIPIYVGKEFWHRLTGEDNFYEALIAAFVSAAKDDDSEGLIEDVVKKLAQNLKGKV